LYHHNKNDAHAPHIYLVSWRAALHEFRWRESTGTARIGEGAVAFKHSMVKVY